MKGTNLPSTLTSTVRNIALLTHFLRQRFFIFLCYNLLLYFPINKFFKEKNHENPSAHGVFFKYVLKTSAGMRYAPVNWLCAHPPLFSPISRTRIFLTKFWLQIFNFFSIIEILSIVDNYLFGSVSTRNYISIFLR